MKIQKLNNNWQMKIASEDIWFPARVPGSIYQDLTDGGRLDDPYWRDNEKKALAIMENHFVYRCVFRKEEKEYSEAILRFESLDTLTEIHLNGRKMGNTENMHRIYEYEVTDILEEENLLEIFSARHFPISGIARKGTGSRLYRCHGRLCPYKKGPFYVWLGLGAQDS